MLRKLGIAVFGLSTILFGAAPSTIGLAAQTFKTKHLPANARKANLQPIGHLASDKILSLDVILPLRDQAALDVYYSEVFSPDSPLFHHWLTPDEFAARFGPTQADYDKVVAYMNDHGLPVTGGSFISREVQLKAPVSAIEAAFHVTINTYQHPTEARTFYAADREPTTDLPIALWHVSGLNNFSTPRRRLSTRDQYAQAHGIKPEDVVSHATTGSGPSKSFLGSDMRAAYYGGTALTGAGQTLGLFEFLGTDLADLTTYYTNVGQTNNVPITLLSVDGSPTTCVDNKAGGNCDDGEQNLDMTQALGMAPGAAGLVMYISTTDDTPIVASIATHLPLAATIGCSWGWDPDDPTDDDPYFQQMAVQGQNFFAASGDDSTWNSTNDQGAAEAWPADDQYVVSVGGTDLVTASAAGPWASETAWNESGGGISNDNLAIPYYQLLNGIVTTANGGSTKYRNGPDVSANANYTFYTCGDQTTCQANYYGGTSFAAPMWAGYIALVNQALVAQAKPTVGFLNPLIYTQNITPATYATGFHDITSGTGLGSKGTIKYTATNGFDLITGWGSPSAGLITTLTTNPGGVPYMAITAASSTLTATTTTVTDVMTVYSVDTFAGGVNLTCAATGGLTCSLSPTSVTLTSGGTNTSTLSVNPAAVTTSGTYSVVVTATDAATGLKTQISTISVTVTVTAANFTLSAASTALTTTSGSTTDLMTLTSTGSFAGSPALTCTAAGGMTCSFAPTSVALTSGSTGTSTLTVNTSGVTTSGTYAVVVTATSGTLVHTVTINVTVTVPLTPDFTLSAASYALTGSGTDVVSLTSTNAFAGAPALTCTATGGMTCSFAPTAVTLTSGSTGTSTLTVNTAGVTTSGNYAVVVSATSGTLVHSVTVNVSVTIAPTFTLTNGGAITIASQGASGSTGLTLTANSSFSGAIGLTCAVTSTPQGATYIPTCSVAPTSVTLAASGTGSSTLTINTTAQTLVGELDHKPLKVKPTSWLAGGLLFALLLLPTLRRRRGLSTLALLVLGALLLGNTVGCSKNAPPATNNPTYTGGTTLGGYVVTVTGTSGAITQTTTVTVTVN